MVLKCLSILSAPAALSVVLKHAAASAFTMRRSVTLCSFFLISYINKYHPLFFSSPPSHLPLFSRSRSWCQSRGGRGVSVFSRTVGVDAGAAGLFDAADRRREVSVPVRERLRAPRTLHGESTHGQCLSSSAIPSLGFVTNVAVCVSFSGGSCGTGRQCV